MSSSKRKKQKRNLKISGIVAIVLLFAAMVLLILLGLEVRNGVEFVTIPSPQSETVGGAEKQLTDLFGIKEEVKTVAVYHVTQRAWLYGGAMIILFAATGLTAGPAVNNWQLKKVKAVK